MHSNHAWGIFSKQHFHLFNQKRNRMVHESFSQCASPSCGIVFTKWVSQNKVEGGEAATGTVAYLGQAGSA